MSISVSQMGSPSVASLSRIALIRGGLGAEKWPSRPMPSIDIPPCFSSFILEMYVSTVDFGSEHVSTTLKSFMNKVASGSASCAVLKNSKVASGPSFCSYKSKCSISFRTHFGVYFGSSQKMLWPLTIIWFSLTKFSIWSAKIRMGNLSKSAQLLPMHPVA
nr:hypothetical protein Iba_chr04dCG0400 [Ipomoea batatas]